MQDQKRPETISGTESEAARGPREIDETALEDVNGGGLLDAEPGTFGTAPRYIGETEKSVWKAPAGQEITHDPAFENWAARK